MSGSNESPTGKQTEKRMISTSKSKVRFGLDESRQIDTKLDMPNEQSHSTISGQYKELESY